MGRNPFNKTVHKEREQPKEMRSLGKLERRKDFVKRAHIKKIKDKTTLYLKRKGAAKNPDEFSTKMQNLRLEGRQLVSTKPIEEESVRSVETQLMVLKNALKRLQKKQLFVRQEKIVFDDNGKAMKADPIDLIDASTVTDTVIDATSTLEERKRRQQRIAEVQKDIRQTERRLQELRQKERDNDKRRKLEIKDEYGDVVATYYQNIRKR